MRKLKNHELGRPSLSEYQKVRKIPLIVVLDNIRSFHNVGAVFRTSDAFLVDKIFLCGITPSPPHRDIHKTALGAENSVAWIQEESALKCALRLKTQGYQILAIEQAEGSISLAELSLDKSLKYAIVFGHEVEGVGEDLMQICDACVEIPQLGTKHSLNISVSAGVLLWECFKQLH